MKHRNRNIENMLLAAIYLKEVGTEENAGKVRSCKERRLEEHVSSNYINLQQASDITGHKKSTLERQSLARSKDEQRFNNLQKTAPTNCDSRTLPEIIVSERSSLCHPQMEVKALSCRGEAICEHDPEALLASTGPKLI